jgi:anti-sigma regulatory factor (Ser/Thr protein kinase)
MDATNTRDCQHGQLARSCDRCADAAEIADLRQQLEDEKRQHELTRGDLERTRLARDEALKDARRYQHLRRPDVDIEGCAMIFCADMLDAVVDESIEAFENIARAQLRDDLGA